MGEDSPRMTIAEGYARIVELEREASRHNERMKAIAAEAVVLGAWALGASRTTEEKLQASDRLDAMGIANRTLLRRMRACLKEALEIRDGLRAQ